MYDAPIRLEAQRLRERGASLSDVSRRLGVSRAALRAWEGPRVTTPRAPRCPRCHDATLDRPAYSALLGFYLGDGHVSYLRRRVALRVSCDTAYPSIIADASSCMASVSRGAIFHVAATGCTVVQSNWKHWLCLLPQHGPGRKHERPIVLEPWQRELVQEHPGPFLRGLFHSDGCRVSNWTRRLVGGELKRYDYPRWQFSNRSDDILALCGWALDLVDIPWRRSGAVHVSVSRREAVARLDALIGLKS